MSCSCYRGQFPVCTFNPSIVSGLWDCVCELQPEHQGHPLHGGDHGLQRLRVAGHPLLPPRPRGGLPGMISIPERYQDWMIYWEPIFLRSCDSAPRPPPPPSVSKLSLFLCLPLCLLRSIWLTWEGRDNGGGRGAESYDRKKAWASINCLILSGSGTLTYEYLLTT